MEMPVRRPVPVRLRGWPGALLFAATRLSGDSAGGLYGRAYPPGVHHRKKLRTALHHRLPTLRLPYGVLARAPDYPGRRAAETRRTGPTGNPLTRVVACNTDFKSVCWIGGQHENSQMAVRRTWTGVRIARLRLSVRSRHAAELHLARFGRMHHQRRNRR